MTFPTIKQWKSIYILSHTHALLRMCDTHCNQRKTTKTYDESFYNLLRRIHLSHFASRWASYTTKSAFGRLRENLYKKMHKDFVWAQHNDQLDWFFCTWHKYTRDTRGQGGGDYDPW